MNECIHYGDCDKNSSAFCTETDPHFKCPHRVTKDQHIEQLEDQLEKAESNNRFKQHTIKRFKARVDELEELIMQLASARGTIHINDVDLWNRVRHEAESIKEKNDE